MYMYMSLILYKVLYGQEIKIKGKSIEKKESFKETNNQIVKKVYLNFFTSIYYDTWK